MPNKAEGSLNPEELRLQNVTQRVWETGRSISAIKSRIREIDQRFRAVQERIAQLSADKKQALKEAYLEMMSPIQRDGVENIPPTLHAQLQDFAEFIDDPSQSTLGEISEYYPDPDLLDVLVKVTQPLPKTLPVPRTEITEAFSATELPMNRYPYNNYIEFFLVLDQLIRQVSPEQ